jgi:hypothetical protein
MSCSQAMGQDVKHVYENAKEDHAVNILRFNFPSTWKFYQQYIL